MPGNSARHNFQLWGPMGNDLKHSSSQRNLNFLKKRHALAGFDSDYIGKLNSAEVVWFEQFSRNYYDGLRDGQSEENFKEANRRRYRAKVADALSKVVLSFEAAPTDVVDDLDPEKILMILEVAGKNKSR